MKQKVIYAIFNGQQDIKMVFADIDELLGGLNNDNL